MSMYDVSISKSSFLAVPCEYFSIFSNRAVYKSEYKTFSISLRSIFSVSFGLNGFKRAKYFDFSIAIKSHHNFSFSIVQPNQFSYVC